MTPAVEPGLAHLLARVVREREAWGGASGVFSAEERLRLSDFARGVLDVPCRGCERQEPFAAIEDGGALPTHYPSGEVCTRHTAGMRPTGHGDFSIGSHVWPGISKLIEERAARCCRCAGSVMATHGRVEHFTGNDLEKDMHAELGDLVAAIEFVVAHNNLDAGVIRGRAIEKRALFERWHEEQQR